MDGENGIIKKITMEKDKNFLIFTNNVFPYKISFDLNTGKYHKISEDKIKEVKNIKPFFAHYPYRKVINRQEFPIYSDIIEMASGLSTGRLYNMGSVLNILRKHIFWEQYLTLQLPVTKDMDYPLTYFPKDILNGIKRAFRLRTEYKEEMCGWHSKYCLPNSFNCIISYMCEESDIFFKAIRYIDQFEDDRDFMQRFSFIYAERNYFVELVKNFHYEYKTLIEYLCYLQNYDGYDYYSDIMRDLYDYSNMSAQMAKMFDKKGKYEKYPHFLKSKHMIISKNYRIMKEEHKEELFDGAYNGSFEYSNGKYIIIEPKSTKDIFKEANQMHNCVASYIDRIIEGRTHIVFLREKENIEDSLVTVEIKHGHICQAYQKNNTTITEEQRNFLAKYAKNKKFILDNV